MTVGKGKRPRDPEPAPVVPTPESLSAYMSAMGRKGGAIGGKRRLVTMTKEQRRKVAAKAAKARWKKPDQSA
jgi:hypothetical protein